MPIVSLFSCECALSRIGFGKRVDGDDPVFLLKELSQKAEHVTVVATR